ncbi:hypothetical protein [Nonomuraea sp. NPDC049709]|uniref:hypothetical protein n=1 Tax=Nonomuraea sp. NPDC049709 TaxID=3154736 RepID=UPI00342C0207
MLVESMGLGGLTSNRRRTVVIVNLEAWAAVAAAAIAAVALYFSATAAIAAKRSAREAAAIAKVEVERREEERERRHEELAPQFFGEIETYISTKSGRRYLWGIVTLSRDYTIAIKTARDWLGPHEVYDVAAGIPCHVKIYPLEPGSPIDAEVRIRFWPPREPFSVPPATPVWQCYCRRPECAPGYDDVAVPDDPRVLRALGRQTAGWRRHSGLTVGPGHWERHVRLALPPELRSEHKSAAAD